MHHSLALFALVALACPSCTDAALRTADVVSGLGDVHGIGALDAVIIDAQSDTVAPSVADAPGLADTSIAEDSVGDVWDAGLDAAAGPEDVAMTTDALTTDVSLMVDASTTPDTRPPDAVTPDTAPSDGDTGTPPIDEPPSDLAEVAPGVTARDVALRFAPIWYQDTANGGPDGQGAKADVPTHVDYDSDLQHDNNWENLPDHPVQPALYYGLVATATHYFLTYSQYHPRDWEQICTGLFTECHEGDMESIQVVVRRDEGGFGEVRLVRTDAHGHPSYWSPDAQLEESAGLAGSVDFGDATGGFAEHQDDLHTHVRIFSEAKGHGPAPCWAEHNFLKPFGMLVVQCPSGDKGFPGGDGLTLIPVDGLAPAYEKGMENGDMPVPYALVAARETLWEWRTLIGEGLVFREDGAFAYEGAQGPPFATLELIGAQFDSQQFINDSTGGSAPWNVQMEGSNLGDPFLDPAWAYQAMFTLPEPFELAYTFHPFLL